MQNEQMFTIKSNIKILNMLLIVYLFFLITNVIKSDIPVHCRKEQILGHWVFRIENIKFTPNIDNPKTSCGNGFPNQIVKTVGDTNFKFDSFYDIELILDDKNNVYEADGKTLVGNFTTVYDEGFIVNYKDSIFTAFSKYYKKTNETKENYESNCDKTMIGWYLLDFKNNNKDWSCFFGFKQSIKSEFEEKFLKESNSNNNNKSDNIIHSKSNTQVLISLSLNTQTNKNLNLKYDQHEVVNEINNGQLTWNAEVHPEFTGLTFSELKDNLGLKRNSNKNTHQSTISSYFSLSNQPVLIQTATKYSKNNTNSNINTSISEAETDCYNITDYNIISKYINTEINDMDINKMPKNWDWRNVGGVNYVPKPRKQMDCGSCYIFSTVSSLESRLRVLTNNKDQTVFSRQWPLACNFYTEGCEGGYPILVSKFFNEFEMIPESCFEYNPSNATCSNICNYSELPTKYKVSRYEYLGGFYGTTNEENMIKEIRARGPIPGNIVVPWTFSYYKNGIYSTKGLKKNTGTFNKVSLFDKNLSWSSVDHSILIVGYGEEDGVKFWIGMNTWGEKWGEDGYFRILRGENECNIETMGDAARIAFEKR